MLVFCDFASAEVIDDIEILKISARDETAVIKTPEGGMRLVQLGDEVGEYKVSEIADGRLVLEGRHDLTEENIIIRLEKDPGGKTVQRIMRIQKEPGKEREFIVPVKVKNKE